MDNTFIAIPIALFIVGTFSIFTGMRMREFQIQNAYDRMYGKGEFEKLLKKIGA